MNTTPLITGKNINVGFKIGQQQHQVLHDANFEIPKGSFTIMYGPSGSGKSTLLNVLVGLQPPETGELVFENESLYQLSPDFRANFRANHLGMVYQTNYWVKSLNVEENVALPLFFLGRPRLDALKAARQNLKRVGMEEFATRRPTVLSGGQQQRVAMARALVAEPDVIVADEPTGNLDTASGDAILELLHYCNNDLGRTVILVTHNLEYLPYGNFLLNIKDGVTETVDQDHIAQTTQELVKNIQDRIARIAQEDKGHKPKGKQT